MAKDFTNDIASLQNQINRMVVQLAEIKRTNSIDLVKTTTQQPNLIGKYRASAQGIYVMIDATNGAYTINLPSAKEARDKVFTFKEYAGLTTTITLTPVAGETIDGASAKTITTAYDNFDLVSDRSAGYMVV